MEQLGAKKLYVRFFDVDMNGNKPLPLAHLVVKQKDDNHEIIPVVFITNRTMSELNSTEINKLAKSHSQVNLQQLRLD